MRQFLVAQFFVGCVYAPSIRLKVLMARKAPYSYRGDKVVWRKSITRREVLLFPLSPARGEGWGEGWRK